MRPAFGRLIVLAAALLLQLAIYDRWIGILDEGFVLQTATEILRGKVLYRDVVIPAPFPGCFYLLAAVFRLFGPTLEVSRVVAVVVFTVMALCVHRLARAVMPPAPALATALLFVAYRMWAFPHWHMVSYSTLGIFFATLAVTLLVGGLPAPGIARLAVAGALGGAALLCKQDSGATALLALAIVPLALPPAAGRLRGFLVLSLAAVAVGLPALAYFWAAGALSDMWAQTVVMPLRWARTFPYPGLPALRPLLVQDPAFRIQVFGYFPGIIITLYWRELSASWLYRSTAFWEMCLKPLYYLPFAVAFAAAVLTWRRRACLDRQERAARVVLLLLAAAFLLAFNKPRDWIHLMVLFYPTLILIVMLVSDALGRAPRLARRAGAAVGWLVVGVALAASAWLAADLRAYTAYTVALPGGTVHVSEDEADVLGEVGRYVEANVPPGAPLPVFPYQPLIQFLLARDAGTRAYVIWPVSPYPDLDRRLIADLERHDVGTVIYSVSQYSMNLRPFQENAPELFAHLVERYEMAKTFSMRPWGLILTALGRRDPDPGPVVFRFAEHLPEAALALDSGDGVVRTLAAAEGRALVGAATWPFERVIAQQPTRRPGTSILRFPVEVPPHAHLRLAYGMNPDRWLTAINQSELRFSIDVETAAGETTRLLDATIDPQRRPEDRRWRKADLDLAAYAGQRVHLAFRLSAQNGFGERPDLAGWADPRLVVVPPVADAGAG